MKNYFKYPCKISYIHYVREEKTAYFTELKIQKSGTNCALLFVNFVLGKCLQSYLSCLVCDELWILMKSLHLYS